MIMEQQQQITSGNHPDLNGMQNSGLTARNVATFTRANGNGPPKNEYSNGHLHRATTLYPRSDSPATNNAPPALPPRSDRGGHHPPEPPQVGRKLPNISNAVSNGVVQGAADVPPPLPPRPERERGHTPPPLANMVYTNGPHVPTSNNLTHRRMSPVPGLVSRGLPTGPGSKRGTSPNPTAVGNPVKVPNSQEIQQQFQQLQINHSQNIQNIFPAEGNTATQEPPPPYPMVPPSHAQPIQPMTSSSPYPTNQPPPPPSYSQSIMQRQSPTFSTNSSENHRNHSNYPVIDFRRSPAPVVPANNLIYPMHPSGGTPIPSNPSPSPSATSMISSSSRNSSTLQHYSRQARISNTKLHSMSVCMSAF